VLGIEEARRLGYNSKVKQTGSFAPRLPGAKRRRPEVRVCVTRPEILRRKTRRTARLAHDAMWAPLPRAFELRRCQV
jgi:hypothetical protein